ncbi:MAG: hypothetical protein GTN78_25840 [Gemmatimonadales bacterium]|nr:hypothetical protein [Gemmatimonadales bacterium]NIN12582.1 hypothetical protein [Gemmatimonadales bacterium]NIR03577.1 hypothetical protein [Gemmatimonadales bacterium]NIS65899.1 hypothetical protein [Gemmatimonadales bacterium]
MIVYGVTRSFCDSCVRELSREFISQHPEVMEGMPPGFTAEMLIEGQLEMFRRGSHDGPLPPRQR